MVKKKKEQEVYSQWKGWRARHQDRRTLPELIQQALDYFPEIRVHPELKQNRRWDEKMRRDDNAVVVHKVLINCLLM